MIKLKINPIATILVITLLLSIVYLITKLEIVMYFALAVGISGLLFNSAAKVIHQFWAKLAWLLGSVVHNILLTMIFYLFLTPIAIFAKRFGKKNQLNLRNVDASLFKEQKEIFDRAFFERPW